MNRFLSTTLYAVLGTVLLVSSTWVSFAQTDTQIIDKEKEQQDVVETKEQSLKFEQFSSCKEMDTLLLDYIKKMPQPRYYMYDDMVDVEMSEAAPVQWGMDADSKVSNNTVTSSSTDFSTTNLQKENVDEADIIKTDGTHIYYFNAQEKKVYIVASPLDIKAATLDLKKVNILNTIVLPEDFYNVDMFLQDNTLVIVAWRYSEVFARSSVQPLLDRSSRSTVALYDVSDVSNLKLQKLTDIDGWYRETRIVDWTLYVLTDLYINRRWFWQNDVLDEKRISTVRPWIVDAIIDWTSTKTSTIKTDCNSISYIMPSNETIENIWTNPQFTVMVALDIKKPQQQPKTNVLFGNIGQIHMSTSSLYVWQDIRMPAMKSCPINARCAMPTFDDWSQTLIHKFAIDWLDINYKASTLVPGSTLTQYSMDENEKWEFRVLTKKNRTDWTNFFVLDKNLDVKWKILWIEPWEQFQSSRYIWDKLYLVTFEQTDPLFVVDIADSSNPRLVWALFMPWYSTYLHPLPSQEVGKQFLIGLWYDTKPTQRWWVQNAWLKIDLYEVDFNRDEDITVKCWKLQFQSEEYNKCVQQYDPSNIYVEQIDSRVLWSVGSRSEALTNPRMFVMSKNGNITLPMVLAEEIETWQRCNVYKDTSGTETTEDCYPITKRQTNFVWLKTFTITPSAWISEQSSIDYLPILTPLYKSNSEYEDIEYRQLYNLNMRVWFAWDALYTFTNDFVHFVLPNKTNQEAYIYFDKALAWQEDDTRSLKDIKSDIDEVVTLSCTEDAECKTQSYWYKACGGWTDFLIYWIETNASKLDLLVSEYYKKDKALKEWMVSDCSVTSAPQVACVNSVCTAK